MTGRRFITIALLCAVIAFGFTSLRPHRSAAYSAIDFAIFYCAGSVAASGHDPYLVEPLRSCERRVWPPEYLRSYAEPAPIPGYAIVPFVLLSLLPFSTAKIVWLAASCFAFGIAVAAGAKISRLPPAAVFALLAVPVALLSFRVGQLGPFIAAALLLCALFLEQRRYTAAAIAVVMCAIEPHVAVPAIAGTFVLVPRTRMPIALGAAALVALHFVVLGTGVGIEYFSKVLPSMGRAEMDAADQFGSIWMLHQFGANGRTATAIAEAAFAFAILAGIILAYRLQKKTARDAFAAVVPAAVTLPADLYLHDVQLCAALALPLLAAGTLEKRANWLAGAAILSMPWFSALGSTTVAVEGAIGCAMFLALSLWRRPIAATLAGTATAATFLAASALMSHLPLTTAAIPVPRDIHTIVFASQSWAAHLYASPVLQARGPQIVVPKMVFLAAILWLCFSALEATGEHARAKHRQASPPSTARA